MRNRISWYLILLLWICGCERNEIIQVDLTGTIEGNVLTYNEKVCFVDDVADVEILLEGGTTPLSAVTDESGSYCINAVPTGTYNVIFNKEGYGTYQIQGYAVVGGSESLNINPMLFQKSGTVISDLTVQNTSIDHYVEITGTVTHNFTSTDYRDPYLRCFISKTADVSPTNYLATRTMMVDVPSGEEYAATVNIGSYFEEGDDLYMVVCGWVQHDYGYYDISNAGYVFPSVGNASDIAHMTIP